MLNVFSLNDIAASLIDNLHLHSIGPIIPGPLPSSEVVVITET